MTIKVAINGYGRIGRNILRALYEANRTDEIQIVGINDLSSPEDSIHLTKYDSVHGPFASEVKADGDNMRVNGDLINISSERDPTKLPWGDLGVDVVYECTGCFTNKESASAHITAGAKKVLISAPAKGVDATVVYGVNHDTIKSSDLVISNASCTTNCLAPVVKPIHKTIGIDSGSMVTVHAYTNDQVLIDVKHSDLRRARSATQSIIPTKTGAAQAVGLVLPELNGKFDGYALRVPVINVSLVDLTFQPSRPTSIEEINGILKGASENEMKGILAYNEEPLVSVDFNHNPFSAIFDATQTRMVGNLVKVLAWYDNEWGFSNRMLDVTMVMMS